MVSCREIGAEEDPKDGNIISRARIETKEGRGSSIFVFMISTSFVVDERLVTAMPLLSARMKLDMMGWNFVVSYEASVKK